MSAKRGAYVQLTRAVRRTRHGSGCRLVLVLLVKASPLSSPQPEPPTQLLVPANASAARWQGSAGRDGGLSSDRDRLPGPPCPASPQALCPGFRVLCSHICKHSTCNSLVEKATYINGENEKRCKWSYLALMSNLQGRHDLYPQ